MQDAIRLQELGSHRQALELYNRIAEHYPDHPDVLHNSGLARFSIGELEAAESLLVRAIRLRPQFAKARENLVKVWTKMDRARTLAEVSLDDAWVAALGFDACMALSEFFHKRMEYDKAIPSLQRAVVLETRNARARQLLGTALYRVGKAEAAERHLRDALELMPDSPAIMVDLARCLLSMHMKSKQGRLWSEGKNLLETARRLAPQNARIQHEMGLMLEEDGDLAQARAAYETALACVPGYLPAMTSLAAISRADASPGLLDELADALAQAGDFPASEISRGYRALGKCQDAQGDFDRAFSNFERANQVVNDGQAYDRAHCETYVGNLVETYCRETIERHWPTQAAPGRPVFIVGMPRSGTTLLEHMLSSHPEIKGAGELPFFTSLEHSRRTLHDECGRPCREWNERLLPAYREALRAEFDTILREVDRDARHVIDKMPFNFSQLGMITCLYPESRIIHCTRNRLDVGLSCFIESFHGIHGWSLSLADIGHYYRQYERLMAHWTALFRDRVHEVSYESLIAERKTTVRSVLHFLGLDWRDEMESYIDNKRPIRTPSHWQVRQPLYATSLARWKRYEGHLGPLIKEFPE